MGITKSKHSRRMVPIRRSQKGVRLWSANGRSENHQTHRLKAFGRHLPNRSCLDGDVWPEQYRRERIVRQDVQDLLCRVKVRPHSLVPGLRSKWLDTYSWRYLNEMPCLLIVTTRAGQTFTKEKRDYLGFFKRPLSWDWIVEKFRRLSASAPVNADR
jgi:hypothetical protein